MKKTYTINLSGKIFHIDEDALEKLQEYINTLKTYYTREEDGNEIMDDIENRIGELFTESLKGQFREVVTLEDVDQAIATMGTPDDIIDEDEQPRTSPSKQAKKLYRNPDDKILGGVAGGMAAYWGISSLLIRICFVLLCCYYGIFIIVYIILWIAVPKAKTTKQKLEMKGESINVSNIERSIKDEYQEIKNGKGRFHEPDRRRLIRSAHHYREGVGYYYRCKPLLRRNFHVVCFPVGIIFTQPLSLEKWFHGIYLFLYSLKLYFG